MKTEIGQSVVSCPRPAVSAPGPGPRLSASGGNSVQVHITVKPEHGGGLDATGPACRGLTHTSSLRPAARRPGAQAAQSGRRPGHIASLSLVGPARGANRDRREGGREKGREGGRPPTLLCPALAFLSFLFKVVPLRHRQTDRLVKHWQAQNPLLPCRAAPPRAHTHKVIRSQSNAPHPHPR
jgi:hypothetical protein